MDLDLVEKVTRYRAKESWKEIRRHYPEATMTTEICDDRGIVTAYQDRYILSKEFVETEKSLCSPHCRSEYCRILMGLARLVLIVPKEQAIKVRMEMLEFTNFYLIYYQIFFYDKDGRIRRMDRKTWCEMAGRPYEEPPRAPEVA